jgi:hypothetical protein
VFSDEDFKMASVVYGGSNETSVLRARSVGLTSSLVQVDSSLEKKVTPEEVCPYPWLHPA